MTNRREFLQTSATIAGALLFPTSIFAKPSSNFHFIHSDTLNHWPVADPVQWTIEHAHEPILARAAEGLSKLTTSDGERIIRLVVRRCSLNLLELHPGRVVVDHWGSNRADLKPFFKSHGLARPEIEVLLRDRKKENVTTLTGDSFLYGVPLASDFDLELFQSKWGRRFEQEADDWQAAPGTSSGFAWEGVEDGFIPWAALKSAWRRSGPGVCQNCSGETFLMNFGLRQVGVFNRCEFVEHFCGACRRTFRDEMVDVKAWMAANLDVNVLPGFEMVWGKRVAVTSSGVK
ncbi:MAG: hypothetical protein NTV29_03755 [Planctomycetota bacterium]|nr:hypothetical protein [Planctomycetota bacterium]